ncbi:unnamed protein product, partial [marine sediment metagenome]
IDGEWKLTTLPIPDPEDVFDLPDFTKEEVKEEPVIQEPEFVEQVEEEAVVEKEPVAEEPVKEIFAISIKGA